MLALQAEEENIGNNKANWKDEFEWEEDLGKVERSMHVLDGSMPVSIEKIEGKVDKQSIMILIDSNCTCSFLDFKMAKELGYGIVKTPPLTLTVANGHKMTSKFKCVGFS